MWDVKPGDLVVFVEEGQQRDIRTGKPSIEPIRSVARAPELELV